MHKTNITFEIPEQCLSLKFKCIIMQEFYSLPTQNWLGKHVEQGTGYLTIFKEDVEQDDADLVRDTDVGVQ